MDNHLLEIIKKTTDYIESNLLRELNLDNISENVNISKFYLLRIWKGATSTGIMEYVRRMRIAVSIGDLLHSTHSIEFISNKYCFGWERTYNRVFKEEFNLTPAKWRRNPTPLNILDRFNADFMNCAGEGLVFFRSIRLLPDFSIAGIEHVVNIEENRKTQIANRHALDFFYQHRHKIINPIDKNIYIGYTLFPSKVCEFIYYQPSIQINQNSIVSPDMKVRKIISHKYGVFTYMGPHRPEDISSITLEAVWNYVHQVWSPTIQFDLKENFYFEYINYAKCNKHYCECDLYYPISPV